MKKQILWGLGLTMGAILSSNAQNVASTTTLTSGGNGAGTLGDNSAYYGKEAGAVVTSSGDYNSFFGHQSGKATTSADHNSFLGYNSGVANTTGGENTFIGSFAGSKNTTGIQNTFIGRSAGIRNQTGNYNVYVGSGAGHSFSLTPLSTSYNTYIGHSAGFDSTGSNNIFIGSSAGTGVTANNRLYITNEDDNTPLIYGDFTQDNLIFNGKVGITEEALVDQGNLFPSTAGGVSVANYQLFVRGGILTEAVRVQLETAWADYVFAPDYELPTLKDVESYIQENGHLPNMPSAEQVKSDGIELGEMTKLQQEKIEELTLYAIDQEKHIDNLEATVAQQQREMEEMKAQIKLLLEKQ